MAKVAITGGRRWRASPDGQGVTFVELFFDLVFVFALTELTGLLRDDLSASGVVRFTLLFWLVWWAWTQFTWALNAADTADHGVQLATLAAVAAAFAMAIGAARAYDGSGLWFALPYVAVRLVGLWIYLRVSLDHVTRRQAVASFTALSSLGLLTVTIGGVVHDPARQWLWAATVALDLVAATSAGRDGGGWDIRPAHFAERHGLFVIIALGESLIATGAPAAAADRTGRLVWTAGAAIALICAMWWLYFAHSKPALERALAEATGPTQSAMARDVYSLLHFPLLGAVVAVAAVIEEAVAHPGDRLPDGVVTCFAVGVALYLVTSAVVHRRAGHGWMWHRVAAAALAVGAVAAVSGQAPALVLTAGASALLVTAVFEERSYESPVPAA